MVMCNRVAWGVVINVVLMCWVRLVCVMAISDQSVLNRIFQLYARMGQSRRKHTADQYSKRKYQCAGSCEHILGCSERPHFWQLLFYWEMPIDTKPAQSACLPRCKWLSDMAS